MRILVVTGRLAEEGVRRAVAEAGVEAQVVALPVSVAAFITPQQAAASLRGVEGFDLILMPGTVQGDVSQVEEATGIPTFKGPLHASDIPLVVGLLDRVRLSKTVPASELMRGELERRAAMEVEGVERGWREVLRRQGGLVVGGEGRELPVGRGFPMRVIAEIVNAPALEEAEIRRRTRYLEAQGADIIDIGMLAGRPHPEKVRELVEAVRASTRRPVSIDTLDPSEIGEAVGAGVDLVLSVDAGNLEAVADRVADVPVVVLPSNMGGGGMPRTAEGRVAALRANLERARELGLTRLIADPVLEPAIYPGLRESLTAYHLFRAADGETPMLFGLGNVAELMDVDSTGVNGLLAALACEVGAELLFVAEASPKTRGSVRETATASRMMFLAKRRGTAPKDLGVDLLTLKEKRWREDPYDKGVERTVRVIEARRDEAYEEDRSGWFRIEVDRSEEMIAAVHHPLGSEEPDLVVKGRSAAGLYKTIIRLGLASALTHAAYLGMELEKAETALRLGRAYVQEEPLFPEPPNPRPSPTSSQNPSAEASPGFSGRPNGKFKVRR